MNMYIYVHKSERKARKSVEHTISQQMPGKCVGKWAIAERESPSETKKKHTIYEYINLNQWKLVWILAVISWFKKHTKTHRHCHMQVLMHSRSK